MKLGNVEIEVEESPYKLDLEKIETLKKGKLFSNERDAIADIIYKKIDMSFLSMSYFDPKLKITVPRFAVYVLLSPEKYDVEEHKFRHCQVSLTRAFHPRIKNRYDVDSNISRIYKSLYEAIYSPIEFTQSIGLRSEFVGIIPTETKEKTLEAEHYFDNINLVAEEKHWQQFEIKADPLVVGIKGGRSYLIDHFDCTPIENFVKSEF